MLRTIPTMSILLSLLLLLVFLDISSSEVPEHCDEKANETSCLTKLYASCPTTCATLLRPKHHLWGGRPKDADDFYNLQVKDIHKRAASFEKYDGTLTLVLVLPKGADADFCTFHYTMLLKLHQVYPWTLEMLLVSPVYFETEKSDKITVLLQPPEESPSEVVSYLSPLIQSGKFESKNLNAFLLSPSGDELQMHVWPEVMTLRTYIDSILKDLEEEF